MKEQLNVSIIGVSGYAKILLDCLREHVDRGDVRVVAAAVRDRSKDSETCEEMECEGTRIYTDWREMLARESKQVDLIVIPSPIHLHREMAIEALKCGIAVFLEKPVAATMEDAEAIQVSVLANKGRLAIGYQDIYAESTSDIAQLLADSEIGDVREVRVLAFWPRGHDYYSRSPWAGRVHLDGVEVRDSPVNNALAHFVTLPLHWLSAAGGVDARAESVSGAILRSREIESYDTASLRVDTSSGVPLILNMTHSSKEYYGPEIFIQGTCGSIRWLADHSYTLSTPAGEKEFPLTHTTKLRKQMMDGVLRWVREGEGVGVCDLPIAIRQCEVVERIHRDLKIETVPNEFIEIFERVPVIEGIDQVFRKLHDSGQFLDHFEPECFSQTITR